MTLSQHTLRSYDKQLQHLMQLILDMGAEVKNMVLAAKESFRARDESRAADAKAADKHINELDHQVEEEATIVLALQNPLAIDLRFVTSILKITGMLERAGDLAKNTVKRSVKMGTFAPEPVIAKLERMADIIIEMLDDALAAFNSKNTEQAIAVWKRDEEIDTLYHEVLSVMQKEMAASPDNVAACTHVVFAAKNLERLADYTTNIAKTVTYVTSGKRADKALLKGLPKARSNIVPARPKPLVLVILDGWGERAAPEHNAMAAAKLPVWSSLLRDFPHGRINASELFVGLPAGQMGNSEVGHMNIGSGRVLMQELPRIDAAIADGSLKKNPRLLEFISALKKSGGTCHLMGLLSPGGVHSHQAHMAALANIVAAADVKVDMHAFLDGRDTPPKSALEYVKAFEKEAKISLSTISGRYYAMDRDKRWDRVQKAYDTLTAAKGERSAAEAIQKSYAAGVTDEFIVPCIIPDYHGMKDGDGLLMANFRADRAREILTALLDPNFKEFPQKEIKFAAALGMVEYSERLNTFMPALFPPQPMTHIFGEIISKAGLRQLRVAETEKYAHVTFFFNGGREEPFPGEERILVPSPKVATYDLKPEMSAYDVTEKLLAAIGSDKFDVIVVNYANADMVGHTGNIDAATKAVEAIDACLGKISSAVLGKGGALVITADHGNAEQMFDEKTHQPHTAHTLNLVPVIIASERLRGKKLSLPEGKLADIAPTLLALLGLPQPAEMTGTPLLAGST